MSCILSITGKNFDSNSFLKATQFRGVKMGIKGQPRFKTKPTNEKLQYSYISIVTSKADFNDFKKQVNDTIKYLKRHRRQLLYIHEAKGIERVTLDFGITVHPEEFSQTLFMPLELVRLAAELGVCLQISAYGYNRIAWEN